MSEDSATTEPLGMLPAKVTPLRVPKKETFLERRQVVVGALSDAFKGKRLSCTKDTVEGSDDW
jgi:hypothetical protein